MIKKPVHNIKTGSHVSFENEYGPQTGRVIDFIPCLVNGREHARVLIDADLPGIVHQVPADTLQLLPNFVFLTGAANPLNVEAGDRRFFVMPNLPPVTPARAKKAPIKIAPYLQALIKRVQP